MNRTSFWLLIWLSVLVLVLGLGVRLFRRQQRPGSARVRTPISSQPERERRLWFVFSVAALAGGGALAYFAFFRPLSRMWLAQDWPAVPCEVTSSEVLERRGNDSDTYRVHIVYTYTFNGEVYESGQYDFTGFSSSGRDNKDQIVSRHPPGSKTVCYVNPQDPAEAVLDRGLTSDLWGGAIALVFVAAGAAGVATSLRPRRQRATGAPSGLAPSAVEVPAPAAVPPVLTDATGNTVVFRARTSAWGKLIFTGLFALVWNGVLSLFVLGQVSGWIEGRGDWLLALFLLPFELIGLGLLVAVLYFLLALFNPRARVILAPCAVPLGGTLDFEWQFLGRTHVLRSLTVSLEGVEEAKYRRGTHTHTDTHVFCRLDVARLITPVEIRASKRTVTIPGHLMHSFTSSHNRVFWWIRLHGEIDRWPDVQEEYPLTVLPASTAERGSA